MLGGPNLKKRIRNSNRIESGSNDYGICIKSFGPISMFRWRFQHLIYTVPYSTNNSRSSYGSIICCKITLQWGKDSSDRERRISYYSIMIAVLFICFLHPTLMEEMDSCTAILWEYRK